MNLSLIPTALDVFRKGSAVADVVKAKNYGALGGALGVLIYSAAQLAKGLGYDLPIDNDTAMHIGVGLSALCGVFVTYATSDKVGLPPKREAPSAAASDVQAGG